MSKSSLVIVVTVLVAGLVGGAAEEQEREHRAPAVRLHVRTAHCELAGSSRPITLTVVCV